LKSTTVSILFLHQSKFGISSEMVVQNKQIKFSNFDDTAANINQNIFMYMGRE